MNLRSIAVAAVGIVLASTLAACGSDDSSSDATTSAAPATTAATSEAPAAVDWATATSDGGDLAALEAAAKEEGALNVIALPHDWANYGAIIDAFKAKYPEITLTEADPGAGSQDEIDAVKGLPNDPDVFDIGQKVAYDNFDKFAPYQVEAFGDIADNLKESTGLVVNDYAGYMTIGYNSAKVPDITSIDDLLKPDYKGTIAFSGDPLTSAEADNSILYAALLKGGSVDDIQPGLDFMKQVVAAGNFHKAEYSADTIASGETNVVFGWGYNQASIAAKIPTWKIWSDPTTGLAGPYYQAISKTAPHPAAARLWEEFLYSADAQNMWLAGGAVPALYAAMDAAGTLDTDAAAKLPKLPTNNTVPTPDEATAVGAAIVSAWPSIVG